MVLPKAWWRTSRKQGRTPPSCTPNRGSRRTVSSRSNFGAATAPQDERRLSNGAPPSRRSWNGAGDGLAGVELGVDRRWCLVGVDTCNGSGLVDVSRDNPGVAANLDRDDARRWAPACGNRSPMACERQPPEEFKLTHYPPPCWAPVPVCRWAGRQEPAIAAIAFSMRVPA